MSYEKHHEGCQKKKLYKVYIKKTIRHQTSRTNCKKINAVPAELKEPDGRLNKQ